MTDFAVCLEAALVAPETSWRPPGKLRLYHVALSFIYPGELIPSKPSDSSFTSCSTWQSGCDVQSHL